MTGDMNERRQGLRVDFNTKVYITVGSQQTHYAGSSRDISLRGIFLCTDDILEINSPCKTEIRLTGVQDEIILHLDGHVVRKEKNGYAIYFDSIDLDSYMHLKNIVKYNSPES